MAAPPSPSSRATAGRRPAGSMTASCARSPTGSSICASSRPGARQHPRLDPRPGQAHARARGEHRRRRQQGRARISTCPSSPSAGPRPPSPASAGWSSLVERSAPTAGPPRRWATSAPRCRCEGGALAGARDILTETLSEDADLLGRLHRLPGETGTAHRAPRPGPGRRKAREFSDYFAHSERWSRGARPPGARHAARGARRAR